MQPNTPQAIASAWDHLADEYAHDLTLPSKRKALATVEVAVIREVLAGRKNLRILDAGCGSGWHAARLAQDGHWVAGVDLSFEMLSKAHEHAASAIANSRLILLKADIRRLPLASGFFDVVISCGTVVSDCGDPDDALGEFSRVLKLDGVAIFSVRNLRLSTHVGGKLRGAPSRSEAGRRTIPQGHRAFDWVLFSVKGLERACRHVGLKLEKVFPVGSSPPPQADEAVESYVEAHMKMANAPDALGRAHELFAVSVRSRE